MVLLLLLFNYDSDDDNDDDNNDDSDDGGDFDPGCVSLLNSKIRSKIWIIKIFRWEKKRCIQKGNIFHSFPFRRYPGERITRLLTTWLLVC